MTTQLDTSKASEQQGLVERPSWLVDWQEKGHLDFSAQTWPTRKTENWKYTPLKSLTDIGWKKGNVSSQATGVEFQNFNEIKIDVINGHIKDLPELPIGVSLVKLTDCSEEDGKLFLQRIEAERSDFIFDQLNQAILDQGYWLKVDAGIIVDIPLHINYISDGDAVVANTQVLVDVENEAKLTLVETFTHTGGSALVNANTALFLQEMSSLTHYHLLLEEGDVRHIGRVTAKLGKFSNLNSFHMAVGGVLKRKDIVIRHCGESAQLNLNGVYLPKGNEVIDYHTTLEHEVPHCTSQEVFRGIIGDQAKAVFNGRIHIHKDAQKSVAELNNRNLLLSPKAEINTKPELEIYADDVRCAHGATIAQLDESLLFYFQARGISKAEAEVMLSFGFINELLDALQDEPVQLLLRPMLATLFSKKKAELARHLL